MTKETTMKRLLLSALALFAFGACGARGSLALQISDAPPDMAKIASVFVTLSKVEVHLADVNETKDGEPADTSIDADNKWIEAPLAAREFDLVQLQGDATAALSGLDLPEGKLTQIRLFIDSAGRNEVVLKTGQTCAMNLNAVSQAGIKINHPFKAYEVKSGMLTTVVLDFDLASSVSEEGACAYSLKPVIKIKLDKSNIAEKP
jgi:hypothetical protein